MQYPSQLKKTRHALAALFLGLMPMQHVLADGTAMQSHQSILDAASRFMETTAAELNDMPAEIHTGKLDSRLHLVQCELPLETFMPSGGRTLGNTTVGVRCTQPKPWTLYVPMTVSIYKQVVVAADTLPRGTILSARQLKLAKRNLAKLPQGYYIDPAKLVGMKLKRNITSGFPLTPTMVAAPKLIKRGQRVTLVSHTTAIRVVMPGKALENGAIGERIRVKNLSSKRVVEGVVNASGEIEVGS